jgi:3'-5' exoribonuclease
MIKDLKQEGKISLFCLITKAETGRNTKNSPYLSLTLEDASGVLDAKYWNISEEQAAVYKPGQVVKASGDLILYRNAWQMRVRSLEIVPDADVTRYIRSAPMSSSEMKNEVCTLVYEMKNPILRSICKTILEEEQDAFFTYPAAVRNHHNFPGGLAYHTLTMCKAAKPLLGLYPFLNSDLLIAGILLHDLGKVKELSSAVLPEYTAAGNLVGHISMMNSRIDRAAVEKGWQDSEEVMLLKHMVLSHHGKLEYGSPVLPMIPEAEVLTLLDNLDARMFMMEQSLEQVDPGHFGPRVFALDNRMLYRRKDSVYGAQAKNEPEEQSTETQTDDEKTDSSKE